MSTTHRYEVRGVTEVHEGFMRYNRTKRIAEPAKTAEEANVLYDLMLEDESMIGPVEVYDMASGKCVRNSMDENEKPLLPHERH